MDGQSKEPRQLFLSALASGTVQAAARSIREGKDATLPQMLELGRALAEACGAHATARQLKAELIGYAEAEVEIPPERKAAGFASPFPVRALDMGLLDPEEIFLANREKFSQVTLTIGQPIEELVTALAQLKQGGVLALRVPAAEVTGESAGTDDDTEVYIYILPREIQRIVDNARAKALAAVIDRIVDASLGLR